MGAEITASLYRVIGHEDLIRGPATFLAEPPEGREVKATRNLGWTHSLLSKSKKICYASDTFTDASMNQKSNTQIVHLREPSSTVTLSMAP